MRWNREKKGVNSVRRIPPPMPRLSTIPLKNRYTAPVFTLPNQV